MPMYGTLSGSISGRSGSMRLLMMHGCKVKDITEREELLTAEEYKAFVESEKE